MLAGQDLDGCLLDRDVCAHIVGAQLTRFGERHLEVHLGVECCGDRSPRVTLSDLRVGQSSHSAGDKQEAVRLVRARTLGKVFFSKPKVNSSNTTAMSLTRMAMPRFSGARLLAPVSAN